jgi:hypothetical protein
MLKPKTWGKKVVKKAIDTIIKRPEFDDAISHIVRTTLFMINMFSAEIKSDDMPYKGQYILEEVIKKLEERV